MRTRVGEEGWESEMKDRGKRVREGGSQRGRKGESGRGGERNDRGMQEGRDAKGRGDFMVQVSYPACRNSFAVSRC